jgi:pyridoxine 4-dehydrogenase
MNDDTYLLAGHWVHRVGFGAMQLPGPRVFGPPRDRLESLDVLRHAVAEGVNHIDTAQFSGPDVANELIHAALPLPRRAGARVEGGGPARRLRRHTRGQRPKQLREGVLANLESLQLDQVPVMNLRRHPQPPRWHWPGSWSALRTRC